MGMIRIVDIDQISNYYVHHYCELVSSPFTHFHAKNAIVSVAALFIKQNEHHS
jgi:hypothetical protein